MDIRNDFKELLELFNKHKVEYLIVGGYALAFHGAPRVTGDIDLFVRPANENAERILLALDEFGFGSLNLSKEDFTTPGMIVQLGVPPVRIDILTRVSGVPWEKADAGKVAGFYADTPVHFIGREDFLVNKRTTGRAKDMADIEALGEHESC
ncbi:MAG TPA: nucleotidyltransferase [Sedimentisphaerales bacterium]|nr:nucleotidyltransferase [Sedimentisphaerales bacterium]